MSTALTILILIAPFAVATAFGWTVRRSGVLRFRLDRFRTAAPMAGRSFTDDRDVLRMAHDLEAIRTRFEHHPVWPSSGALGERL